MRDGNSLGLKDAAEATPARHAAAVTSTNLEYTDQKSPRDANMLVCRTSRERFSRSIANPMESGPLKSAKRLVPECPKQSYLTVYRTALFGRIFLCFKRALTIRERYDA